MDETAPNTTKLPTPVWTRRKVLLFALGFEGAMGLIALPIGCLFKHCPTETLRLSFWDLLFGCLAAAPLLLVFLLSYLWPIGPLKRIRQFLEEVAKPFFAPCRGADLFLLAVFAGLGEELLFRGLIQNLLSLATSPLAGLLGASILFGLAHLITPAYAIIAGAIGAYLGWTWEISGNLLVPITAHAFYDFLALVLLMRVLPGAPSGSSATTPLDSSHKEDGTKTL